MDTESSTKFIGSLTKFLQSLCNGYVEFDDGVELIGHLYLSVDSGKTGKTLNYFLNEKVCKNDNSVTFISNSFHAQPEGKAKPGKDSENRKDDGVSDFGDGTPRSTNMGTVLSRPQAAFRSGALNQNRAGVHAGTKRPGSPLKGPAAQRRPSTPPSQRRLQSSGARGSPGSKTIPSSPSSSSQDNIPSPSTRKSRNDIGQPGSNQSDNGNADNESDVMSINPTPEFANFLGSLTGDNQNSEDQPSPPETKPDTDVTFIKEEYVAESGCSQAGGSGQHSGQSGEDGSGLYPVMLHQNPTVYPSTSGSYSSYHNQGRSSSSQPVFPGSSSSQSDPFNPAPGTSQDGADPSVYVARLAESFGRGNLEHFSSGVNKHMAVSKLPFSCTLCGKQYKNKIDCEGHVNSQHLHHKPFMCTGCYTRFPYMRSLRRHKMICPSAVDTSLIDPRSFSSL